MPSVMAGSLSMASTRRPSSFWPMATAGVAASGASGTALVWSSGRRTRSPQGGAGATPETALTDRADRQINQGLLRR